MAAIKLMFLTSALLVVACHGPDVAQSSASLSMSSSGAASSGEPSTSMNTGQPTSSSAGTSESSTSHTFLGPGPDLPAGWCDTWMQSCPEGQKCVPYSGDGDNSWESLKCVDVSPKPGSVRDPCTSKGVFDGSDDCDKGLMCWNVDPITNMGTCIALCTGSELDPMCPPMTMCALSGSGILNLCLSACSPLLQDCPGNDLCIPNPFGHDFVCVLDASGDEGQVFDPCAYANACDKGLICVDVNQASECAQLADGCCLPFCDLSAPTCPGVGQQCLPWYEMDTAPPGFEQVGICGVPS